MEHIIKIYIVKNMTNIMKSMANYMKLFLKILKTINR